ncbi:hypothetical protein CgunFtcFv8_005400 [Champsocephalus gunnari]|uniref:Uncharacterized protein n=1 Tax=Champsocephalus gunnari TaxID=52237 RepID=A0AAN8CZS2_CHAGU|nr:hypothetical protein CgunFtcFv8_005400 [Champsocephalus gunnari]
MLRDFHTMWIDCYVALCFIVTPPPMGSGVGSCLRHQEVSQFGPEPAQDVRQTARHSRDCPPPTPPTQGDQVLVCYTPQHTWCTYGI